MGVPLTEIIFLAICKELKLSDNYKDTTNRKITNPFGGELTVAPAGGNQGYGYSLTLTGLPTSACISLGTLNLGASTAAYAISNTNGSTPQFPGSGGNKGPISPATAATQCTSDSNSRVPAW